MVFHPKPFPPFLTRLSAKRLGTSYLFDLPPFSARMTTFGGSGLCRTIGVLRWPGRFSSY